MGLVELDDEEVEFLKDLCDFWLDGMDGATRDVEQDRTLKSPEEMLEAVSGMHEQYAVAMRSREKLQGQSQLVPSGGDDG